LIYNNASIAANTYVSNQPVTVVQNVRNCIGCLILNAVCGEFGFASGGLPDLPATPAIFYK
jgi:hypothetical protein